MSKRVLIFCGLLALSSISFAADKDVEALLAKMRNAYKSVKTAHFVTRAKSPVPEGEWVIVSDVTYQAPNKIFAKLNGIPVNAGKVLTITSDGKKIGLGGLKTPPASKPFTFQNFGDETGNAMNLESINFWDWKRQLSTAKGDNMAESDLHVIPQELWSGKNWVVLEERAPRSGVYVRYFIDPKTYFVRFVRVTDLSGNQPIMDAELVKLETNVKVDPKLFIVKS